jgi:S-DNA-T family DNA segregation ATPase FtsK/SpoIIIE
MKTDSTIRKAAEIIVKEQFGSISLIQRRLKLGYNKSARIMDDLENLGVVGAFQGVKQRDVLVNKMDDLEKILTLNNI